MTRRWGGWNAVLVAACLTPLVAIFVKPMGYSFYMFHSAMPDALADWVRLALANIILVGAAAAAVASALALLLRAWPRRRWVGLVAPAVVALHPLLQPVFFEKLDTALNYRWYRRAIESGIMGRTEPEVRLLLGTPTYVLALAPSEVVWEYAPLSFYWFGSKGQVLFTHGHVTYVEPNDD